MVLAISAVTHVTSLHLRNTGRAFSHKRQTTSGASATPAFRYLPE